jgi:hypothetical protein
LPAFDLKGSATNQIDISQKSRQRQAGCLPYSIFWRSLILKLFNFH